MGYYFFWFFYREKLSFVNRKNPIGDFFLFFFFLNHPTNLIYFSLCYFFWYVYLNNKMIQLKYLVIDSNCDWGITMLLIFHET